MPSPWNPGFLDRIKNQVINRVTDRVKQELAPEVKAPALGTQPGAPEDESSGMDPGFLGRIKNQVKQKVQRLGPVQRRLLDPQAALDDATMKFRIQYAGQNHLLVLMRYNNQWRHVEPYSYRASGKNHNAPVGAPGPKELRFYGFCRVHDEIHSFDPKKIQGLMVTDMTYNARWPIEVA